MPPIIQFAVVPIPTPFVYERGEIACRFMPIIIGIVFRVPEK
jgi:hypothetical protein